MDEAAAQDRLVARLLREKFEDGEIDRQLRVQHRKWGHVLEYDEFRNRALAKAWESRDGFRGDTGEEFLAWLRQIAWSIAVDAWRGRRRESNLLRQFAALLPRTPGLDRDRLETRDFIAWLLAGLSERERRLLRLKYYGHMTAEQIAAEMGMTVAAVNQLHYRAIARLRKKTENPAGER